MESHINVPASRGDRAGALALFAIGAVMLATAIAGEAETLMMAVIGAVSMAAFAFTREYGFAVAGGVMGGLGMGVLLVTNLPEAAAGAAFMLSMAGGFAVIWPIGFAARPAERHPWPLVPATILGVVGVAAATDLPMLGDLVTPGIALILIVVGIVTFARTR